jgi:uncharacterized coiled-coil protein SlyX
MSRLFTLTAVIVALLLATTAIAQDTPPPPQTQDELKELRQRVAKQEETIKKLMEELSETKAALEKAQQKLDASSNPEQKAEPAAEPLPKVEGAIIEVRMDRKLVLLDLGKADKLEQGDVFEVIRAGKKIGSIRICVPYADNLSNADVIDSTVDFIPGDKVVMTERAPKETQPSAEAELEVPEKVVERKTVPLREPASTEIEELRSRLVAVEGLCADLAKQVERLQDKLEKGRQEAEESLVRESAPIDTGRAERPVDLEAAVIDVADKVVFISAGKDHGIQAGDTFLIKRGKREIATVRVTSTIEDMCKAEIITKASDIQKRDSAILK